MKQTAVEWLFEKLWNTSKDKFTWYAILKQAKEIEREQIETAFFKGDLFAEDYFDADNPTKDVSENYYKQTFNK
jgi:hypothetical protein